jgi:hypothetical protein
MRKTCWCSFFGRLTREGGLRGGVEVKNDTSTLGYAGLQLMKGKVIVIDNQLEATRNMVVKNKYVLASTSDITFKRFNPNQPDPQQGNDRN